MRFAQFHPMATINYPSVLHKEPTWARTGAVGMSRRAHRAPSDDETGGLRTLAQPHTGSSKSYDLDPNTQNPSKSTGKSKLRAR